MRPLRWFAFLVLAAMCAGASSGEEPPDFLAPSTLVVIARDSLGRPPDVGGWFVVEPPHVAAGMDSLGVTRIHKIPPGRWLLIGNAFMFLPCTTRFTIAPGVTETLQVTMAHRPTKPFYPEPFDLWVSVVGPAGEPLEGCKVSVDDFPNKGRTDKRGMAQVKYLSSRAWTVRVSRGGCEPYSGRVVLRKEHPDTLRVMLAPASGR